jgi:hypothetical protein
MRHLGDVRLVNVAKLADHKTSSFVDLSQMLHIFDFAGTFANRTRRRTPLAFFKVTVLGGRQHNQYNKI